MTLTVPPHSSACLYHNSARNEHSAGKSICNKCWCRGAPTENFRQNAPVHLLVWRTKNVQWPLHLRVGLSDVTEYAAQHVVLLHPTLAPWTVRRHRVRGATRGTSPRCCRCSSRRWRCVARWARGTWWGSSSPRTTPSPAHPCVSTPPTAKQRQYVSTIKYHIIYMYKTKYVHKIYYTSAILTMRQK